MPKCKYWLSTNLLYCPFHKSSYHIQVNVFRKFVSLFPTSGMIITSRTAAKLQQNSFSILPPGIGRTIRLSRANLTKALLDSTSIPSQLSFLALVIDTSIWSPGCQKGAFSTGVAQNAAELFNDHGFFDHFAAWLFLQKLINKLRPINLLSTSILHWSGSIFIYFMWKTSLARIIGKLGKLFRFLTSRLSARYPL